MAGGGRAYAQYGRPAATLTYTTVPAEIGNFTVEVSATGILQPLIQVDISSELSGVVRSVAVVENQRVKKGDVLAALDTVRMSAQVERAEASAKAAQAKVTEARTTLDETERTLIRCAVAVEARHGHRPGAGNRDRRARPRRRQCRDRRIEPRHRRRRS